MSGPKSSSYRLSAAQLRALMEEAERRRQEQIRKEKIRISKEQIAIQKKNLDKLVALMQPVLSESFVSEELQQKANDVIRESQTIISQCLQDQKSDNLEQLESDSRVIKEKVKRLKAAADQVCLTMPEDIANERMRIEDSIADGFKFVLPEPIHQAAKKNSSIRQEISRRIDELGSFPLPDIAKRELENLMEKAATITSLDFLENYLTLDIDPFISRCQTCIEMDYLGIRARYEILAKERNTIPQEFEYSAKGIEEMKAAANTLEAEILADRERAYIHEALETAIQEMGYKLIGDRVVVRQKSGKQIKHKLYSLRDGTAVDVTLSDDGQISMELGGITHSDRVPTAEESVELVEDMKSFCKDYDVLERKLAARGVQTHRIRIVEPAIEYARMINVDKYQLSESTSEYQTQKTRRQEQKYFRKE